MQVSAALFLFMGIILTSCSSRPVDLSEIKEIKRSNIKKCSYIDATTVQTDLGDEKLVLKDLKLNILKLKGDSYIIDESVQNGSNIKVSASVYTCKQ